MTDHHGQLVCSPGGAASDLLAHLFQPHLQAGHAVRLDAMADGKADEPTTGMFL